MSASRRLLRRGRQSKGAALGTIRVGLGDLVGAFDALSDESRRVAAEVVKAGYATVADVARVVRESGSDDWLALRAFYEIQSVGLSNATRALIKRQGKLTEREMLAEMGPTLGERFAEMRRRREPC